jgi:hypothetical protein
MKLETPKQIIDALKSSKSPQEKTEVVRYVTKEYISSSLKDGNSTLEKNSESQDVRIIQTLLAGLGYISLSEMTGELDIKTMQGIKQFGSKSNVAVDVNKPLSKEVIDLFYEYQFGAQDYEQTSRSTSIVGVSDSTEWPPEPNDLTNLTVAKAEVLYGKIEWKRAKGDNIIITNNFKDNIITIDLPQLAKIQNPTSTKIRCHKLAADPIRKLWQEWEDLGFLDKIENWMGCFYPRTVRPKDKSKGPRPTLSNHAFGVAFDINTLSNGYGVMPPVVGQKGSIRELVPIANKLGFYWGGHFKHRDGMHFELVNPSSQLMIA